MRILVLSDLHLELASEYAVPDGTSYDAVVLAGDIHAPVRKAVRWAQEHEAFGDRPVILVPGNHEFYRAEMSTELDSMRKAARGSNVQVLARDVVVIGGVRFVGAILWTDFALPVSQPDGARTSNVERAVEASSVVMNDYRMIRVANVDADRRPGLERGERLLTAPDTMRMHGIDRHWLGGQTQTSFEGPTVVVTHHAPAAGSIAKRYAADWSTPAFVSALPQPFFAEVDVWIHGHTHTSFDYVQGQRCRVVSNPRGYRLKDSSFENPEFAPGLVVEV